MQYTVVATLLPSFAAYPISPPLTLRFDDLFEVHSGKAAAQGSDEAAEESDSEEPPSPVITAMATPKDSATSAVH